MINNIDSIITFRLQQLSVSNLENIWTRSTSWPKSNLRLNWLHFPLQHLWKCTFNPAILFRLYRKIITSHSSHMSNFTRFGCFQIRLRKILLMSEVNRNRTLNSILINSLIPAKAIIPLFHTFLKNIRRHPYILGLIISFRLLESVSLFCCHGIAELIEAAFVILRCCAKNFAYIRIFSLIMCCQSSFFLNSLIWHRRHWNPIRFKSSLTLMLTLWPLELLKIADQAFDRFIKDFLYSGVILSVEFFGRSIWNEINRSSKSLTATVFHCLKLLRLIFFDHT